MSLLGARLWSWGRVLLLLTSYIVITASQPPDNPEEWTLSAVANILNDVSHKVNKIEKENIFLRRKIQRLEQKISNSDKYSTDDDYGCSAQTNPCGTNAICHHTFSGQKCTCPSGFEPKPTPQVACEPRVVGISCMSDLNCVNNASCIAGKCSCNEGFIDGGATCWCMTDSCVFSQSVVLIKKSVSTLLTNTVSKLPDTKASILFQRKLSELKSLNPMVFRHLKDIYFEIILPTSTDTVAIVKKLLADTDHDFQEQWVIVMNDVPKMFNKFRQGLEDNEIVQNLRSMYQDMSNRYPVVPSMTEIAHTSFEDIIALTQKLAAHPVDIRGYWTTFLNDGSTVASKIGQRIQDAQIMEILKEDGYFNYTYTHSILPAIQELKSIPDLGNLEFQESIQKFLWIMQMVLINLIHPLHRLASEYTSQLYMTLLSHHLPPQILRPSAEFLNDLSRALSPVSDMSGKFHHMVMMPTVDDVLDVVVKLVDVPITDIEEPKTKYWDIVKAEAPIIMKKFIQRIPTTQLGPRHYGPDLPDQINKLKAKYPQVYEAAIEVHSKVVAPAVSDLLMLYYRINNITDMSFNSHGKSYKIFKDMGYTWDEAKDKCTSEGLTMASNPSDAVGLRKYILETFGDGNYVWLDARSDSFRFVWQQDGSHLSNNSTLWMPDEPRDYILYGNDGCLTMEVRESYWSMYPDQPYIATYCRFLYYTLCEVSV